MRKNTLDSSAKKNDNTLDEYCKSFIYNINKSGPRRDPCGTRHT